MELKMPIIKNYLVTWHDGEHSGFCFDEDEFYTVEDLIRFLKDSNESIKNNYTDYLKVWIRLYSGELIELCNIDLEDENRSNYE